MTYTLILTALPGTGPEFGTDEWKTYAAEWGAFNEEATKAGVLKAGQAVQPADRATTVRVDGGKVALHDGPFAEIKEEIIGWYQLQCDDLDSAVAWAAKVPNAARGYGAVEIRPDINYGPTE